MAQSQQATFGFGAVNRLSESNFSSDMRCDKHVGWENGEPKRCTNSATLVVMPRRNEIPEFYCLTHSCDTWKEMAGISD